MNSKPIKILIAEDNETYRKLLAAMIEKITGHYPDCADDGEKAYLKAMDNEYDIIFMDNHMPKLTGTHVTEMIRRAENKIRQPHIVAVTGSSSSCDLHLFRSAGMNSFLLKPFRFHELVSEIEKVFMTADVEMAAC